MGLQFGRFIEQVILFAGETELIHFPFMSIHIMIFIPDIQLTEIIIFYDYFKLNYL